MNVQSCIVNLGFPATINAVQDMLYKTKRYAHKDYLDIETILDFSLDYGLCWSMPKWMQCDDVVFFYHAITANVKIKRLIKQYREQHVENARVKDALNRALGYYDLYGGKIFAIGRVMESPKYLNDDSSTLQHFKGRIFGMLKDIEILKTPIEITEFSSFIQISKQSSVTSVFGESYAKLKKIIVSYNNVSEQFSITTSTLIPLKDINDDNFLSSIRSRINRFVSENQFRGYYVDYLLSALSEIKPMYECYCFKDGISTGIVDNTIQLQGRLFFVEVKLNIKAEKNIIEQLKKYTNIEYIKPSNNKGKIISKKICSNKVIIIDTMGIYIFDDKDNSFYEVEILANLVSHQNLKNLKWKIISMFDT